MKRGPRAGLLVVPALFALGLAAYAAWMGWSSAGGAEMSFHGFAALLLGVGGTLMLAALLVGLLLYSRRHGFDRSWPDGNDPPGPGRRNGVPRAGPFGKEPPPPE